MAEVIGLSVNIIALIQLTGRLTSMGYDYIGGVKRASKDCKDLVYELSSLSKVLTTLQDYIEKPGVQSAAIQQLNERDGPVEECIKDLTELQSKLGTRGGLKGLIDSLKWPFKEAETLQYIARIERHKSLFTFALTADQLALSKAIEAYIRGVDLAVQRVDKYAQDTNAVAHETKAVTHEINFVAHDTNATVHSLRENIKTDAAVQEEIRLAEKRDKILIWLYPGAFDTKHMEIRKKRQKNTGEWIFGLTEFQKWAKQESDSNTLCGYGIPGAGKTFVSSLVIDHFEALAETENYGVAYIYFDYSDQNQQRPPNIFASLLKQLACRLSQLPPEIEQLHDRLCRRETRPTLEDLYTALHAIHKSFSRVFFTFDALDECNEEHRSELLPFFERMGMEGGMSLFFTSRPYSEDIHDCLSGAEKIEIYAQEADVRTYIEEKINENRRARRLIEHSKCKDRIVDQLAKRAEGMFLLVRFHVEYICQQTTANQVLTALDKIQSSSTEERPLDPTYSRAIQNVYQQNRRSIDLALRLFSWLIEARRVLTVEEIRVAVSVEQDRYKLDEFDLPDRATLLEVCAGLVTIDKDTNTVRLAHYTVREYLVENSIALNADLNLAMACTTYLSFNAFSQGPCTSDESMRERFELHPLLRYAARYFALHLSTCNEHSSANSFLRFLKSPGIISSWRQASAFSIAPTAEITDVQLLDLPTRSPLHIACEIGHKVAVQQLIENGFDISAPDKDSQDFPYPLHIAAQFGRETLIQFLLEKGADISVLDRYRGTVLHRAVAHGNEAAVQILIENGADLSAPDVNGDTVLHLAILCKNETILRLLVEKGANVSARDGAGNTVLHWAVLFKKVAAARLLVEKGADVSVLDRDGNTVLHLALSPGKESMFRLLIESGADASASDISGVPVLHRAVLLRNEAAVRILVENGVDVSALDRNGGTALHLAVFPGNESVLRIFSEKGTRINAPDVDGFPVLHRAVLLRNDMAVRILVENGADVSALDRDGDTALHKAALSGDEAILKLLVENGADVSALDGNRNTVLHLALSHGKEEVLCFLVNNGADISAADKNGNTVLHWAILNGKEAVLQLLIESGVDVCAIDKDGDPVLHRALPRGNEAILQLLIDRGADISAIDKSGDTVLHQALSYKKEAIFRFLVENGADVSALDGNGNPVLHRVVLNRNEALVRFLVEHGADVSTPDSSGDTALHRAVLNGNETVTRFLIERGADISAIDKDGDTVLHLAILRADMAVLQFLVESGIDLSALDRNGDTALHRAVLSGNEAVARILVDKGADISALDRNGNTALHRAVLSGDEAVARLLVDKGADISALDRDGDTALHLAVFKGKEAVLQLLLEKGGNVSALDSYEDTPLHRAALHGNEPAVQILLEHGASKFALNKYGYNAMSYGIFGANQEVIRLLGPPPHDENASTAQHEVAQEESGSGGQ